jgi:hypothetical protein
MKKLTILSGPSGSGKSHISDSIEMQHDDVLTTTARGIISKLSIIPFTPTLIILTEIQKTEIESTYKLIYENYPNANIVMQTQDDITAKDYDFAHVINCRNVMM